MIFSELHNNSSNHNGWHHTNSYHFQSLNCMMLISVLITLPPLAWTTNFLFGVRLFSAHNSSEVSIVVCFWRDLFWFFSHSDFVFSFEISDWDSNMMDLSTILSCFLKPCNSDVILSKWWIFTSMTQTFQLIPPFHHNEGIFQHFYALKVAPIKKNDNWELILFIHYRYKFLNFIETHILSIVVTTLTSSWN